MTELSVQQIVSCDKTDGGCNGGGGGGIDLESHHLDKSSKIARTGTCKFSLDPEPMQTANGASMRIEILAALMV